MTNCFCGMVDWRKAFSLISSRGHCQRSSPLRISDAPQAGFEPAQNLSSGFVEWSCAVVITTTPGARHHATTSRKKYSSNKQITRCLLARYFFDFHVVRVVLYNAKRWGVQTCKKVRHSIMHIERENQNKMENGNQKYNLFFFFF